MFVNQYAVTTTPTKVVSANSATPGENMGVSIQNLGSVSVWLAEIAAKATSTGGYQLAAGATLVLDVPGGENTALYAATASGTSQVAVLQS